MSNTAEFRKNDELEDLLALASDVTASAPSITMMGTARDAARALSGLASWVAHRTTVNRMQECFTEIVRHAEAWKRGAAFMRDLPMSYNGCVDEYVALIAVVSSSLLHNYNVTTLRSAMAYWATERDPAAWQQLVEWS